MDNLSFQYYKSGSFVSFLIIYIALLSWLSSYLKEILIINGFNISIPSVSVVIGFTLILMDRYLYKIPFLWNFLIKVPYIGGKYKGKINFVFIDNGNEVTGEKICDMDIYQTCSKIKVTSQFYYRNRTNQQKTTSESKMELLEKKDDSIKLYFAYRNYGVTINNEVPSGMGFNILNYKKNQKNETLEGTYFSERVASKNGTITLKKIKTNGE
jgi:hypothetical protein